ncbi:MAG: chorismate pyruvate-lyase family protein [Candidatus Hydrothermarchaeales archaeon]
MIDKLKRIEEVQKLNPVHKILLTTDGSITRILEALVGEKVEVETEFQEVIKSDRGIAELLNIAEGEEVNYRVVNLKSSKRVLVHAISYTPIKGLREEFREDIMKGDTPIGIIMSKLKIEARREIRDFSLIEADEKLANLFGVRVGASLLKRNYDIIHDNRIMMNITEIFPYELV